MKTYSRLFNGTVLTVNIISINENKVVYFFTTKPKKIIKEYTPLFLSVFTENN